MSSYLYRVGRFAARYRWWVIAVWLVIALGGAAVASALGGALQSSFQIPGTQSQSALDALEQRFPQLSGASARVVLVAPASTTGIAAHEDAVVATCEQLAAIPEVSIATCPYPMAATGSSPAGDGSAAQIAANGTMAFVSLQLTVASTDITDGLVAAVEHATGPATAAGLQAAYSGLVAAESSGVDWTELVGIAIAFVVLAVTFGSVLAAGVPLVTALVGVGAASSSILIVAAFAPVSSTAPLLATMLGLAVGIDYALLIASRHRAQVAAGMDIRESVAVATATAGTAVVFAGGTVMIALLGLAVAGIPFLTVMGLGAAAAVLFALAVAVTLLPAVLAVLGRTLRPRTRRPSAAQPVDASVAEPVEASSGPRDARWVRLVTRVPLATVALVGVALVALAVPATALRLTLPDAGYDPAGSPARTAYDLLDSGFGPGFNGPLLVTADISGTLDIQGALSALDGAFGGIPDVVNVSKAVPNQALDLAVLSITPASAPSSDATTALVRELRSDAPAFEAAHGFGYQVTGQTALAIDISDRLAEALLPFAIVVVGLCLLLLTIMFRSLAVPLTATLGYLLTVGAALGASTAVFEWGWGANLIGVTKVGPVISFMPILVMAVLFGLAMDYHVFLVSRMRERYTETGDARRAVREGFSASARVVTAAALIMFAVFFSFVPGGNTIIQPIALALAVGVLIDAFVVRMTLIPALMMLLGRHAWWLPTWLDRILPNADIEGEAVQRMLAQRAWRDAGASGREGFLAAGLVVDGSAPIDATAPERAVVLLRGLGVLPGALLAVVAGRLAPEEGDLAIRGRLLPFDRAAIAKETAYVGARVAESDAQTVAEHLRTGLGLAGARRAELTLRVHRAAEIFDDLTAGRSGASGITPGTPLGALDDAHRWLLDAAIALASPVRAVAFDLRGHPGEERILATVLRHADLDTVVYAATSAPPPATDRVVVEIAITAPVAATLEGELR